MIDKPTGLSCALHGGVSQHISTLPRTSSTHILGVLHAQVKHFASRERFSRSQRDAFCGVHGVREELEQRKVVRAEEQLSLLDEQCPMEFRVHQRKHHWHGTWRSTQGSAATICRSCVFGTARTRSTRRTRHLSRKRRWWDGMGRTATIDTGAGTATLRQNVVPRHPQCPPGRRSRGLDLDQIRRHDGHRPLEGPQRLDLPLRPERRARVPTGSGADRVVAAHHGRSMGCRRAYGRCHGPLEPPGRGAVRPCRRRVALVRAGGCAVGPTAARGGT